MMTPKPVTICIFLHTSTVDRADDQDTCQDSKQNGNHRYTQRHAKCCRRRTMRRLLSLWWRRQCAVKWIDSFSTSLNSTFEHQTQCAGNLTTCNIS